VRQSTSITRCREVRLPLCSVDWCNNWRTLHSITLKHRNIIDSILIVHHSFLCINYLTRISWYTQRGLNPNLFWGRQANNGGAKGPEWDAEAQSAGALMRRGLRSVCPPKCEVRELCPVKFLNILHANLNILVPFGIIWGEKILFPQYFVNLLIAILPLNRRWIYCPNIFIQPVLLTH